MWRRAQSVCRSGHEIETRALNPRQLYLNSMASKRTREKVEDFKGLDEPVVNASVHGVISSDTLSGKEGTKEELF